MSRAQATAHDFVPAGSGPEERKAAARSARLHYVNDRSPGIRRVRTRNGFAYRHPDGRMVTDAATLARIRKLAIPPAYEDVWICRDPSGHLQAVGRDARGRKQYRYHPRWRDVRDTAKFGKLSAFGQVLPRIRARVEHDLARRGLPREKVLAVVVRLLEITLMRVGNEEYARRNRSYGLTTLRNRHVKVEGGSRVCLDFRGKHGHTHHIDLRSRRLARLVRRCQDLPGQELFQYIDEEGAPRAVTSGDVNDYLQEITGEEITAKDFRTWAATTLAATAFREVAASDSKGVSRKDVARVIEVVAKTLGNTPAICRRCYIHPAILEGYLDGSLLRALSRQARAQQARAQQARGQQAGERRSGGRRGGERNGGLKAEEGAVLTFLRRRLAAAGEAPG